MLGCEQPAYCPVVGALIPPESVTPHAENSSSQHDTPVYRQVLVSQHGTRPDGPMSVAEAAQMSSSILVYQVHFCGAESWRFTVFLRLPMNPFKFLPFQCSFGLDISHQTFRVALCLIPQTFGYKVDSTNDRSNSRQK